MSKDKELGSLEQQRFKILSPRSRCWQGRFLLRAVRESLVRAFLLESGGLRAILVISWILETSCQPLSSSS